MDLAVVLYTISDYNLRSEFTNELEKQGFEKHPDQSTYTYPMPRVGDIFLVDKFSQWIEKWSQGKSWGKSDFISIYYLDFITSGAKFTAIKNKTYSL